MIEKMSWFRRVFDKVGQGRRNMLALVTPEAVRDRSPLVRLAVAGATLGGLFVATAVGLTAFAALLFAVGAIYFIVTQVLGLKVNVDPQAFAQQFYRAAASSSPYGAN